MSGLWEGPAHWLQYQFDDTAADAHQPAFLNFSFDSAPANALANTSHIELGPNSQEPCITAWWSSLPAVIAF